MASTIFMFSRDVPAARGVLRQNVIVYAPDQASAQRLLEEHLEKWRGSPGRGPSGAESAYDAKAGWQTNSLELDEPKVVSALLTH